MVSKVTDELKRLGITAKQIKDIENALERARASKVFLDKLEANGMDCGQTPQDCVDAIKLAEAFLGAATEG